MVLSLALDPALSGLLHTCILFSLPHSLLIHCSCLLPYLFSALPACLELCKPLYGVCLLHSILWQHLFSLWLASFIMWDYIISWACNWLVSLFQMTSSLELVIGWFHSVGWHHLLSLQLAALRAWPWLGTYFFVVQDRFITSALSVSLDQISHRSYVSLLQQWWMASGRQKMANKRLKFYTKHKKHMQNSVYKKECHIVRF